MKDGTSWQVAVGDDVGGDVVGFWVGRIVVGFWVGRKVGLSVQPWASGRGFDNPFVVALFQAASKASYQGPLNALPILLPPPVANSLTDSANSKRALELS